MSEPSSPKYEQIMRESNAPKLHVQFDGPFESPDWNKTIEEMRAAIKPGACYAFIGRRDGGKTQLAVELMKDLARAGRAVEYTRVYDLYADIKASWKPVNPKSEIDILRHYERPSLLVVDEVHERTGQEWDNRILANIVDRRYGAMRTTLLVGNFETRQEFSDHVGDSVSSRMKTGGVIQFTWNGFRKRS